MTDSSAAMAGKSPELSSRPPIIGIIGGGQLAKMLIRAASVLGLRTVILERNDDCPAAAIASQTLTGDWNDPDDLARLASATDLITLENEFVHADALAQVEQQGREILPGSHCMGMVQDKLRQKEALLNAGLPVPEFYDTPDFSTARNAAKTLGYPLVLKRRRYGYDGKGNALVETESELETAWRELGGETIPLLAEAYFHFTKELAVIVTRSQRDETRLYPVVETFQENHVCRRVAAPVAIDETLAENVTEVASEIAQGAIDAVAGIGSFGVEMFLGREGTVVINELAPRVHNSGHYSIEACASSQFENHIRAILGWPLGSTTMRAPASVMINLLGTKKGPGWFRGIDQALRVEGAHVHLYGKQDSRPGRKMGHVTALGNNLDEASGIATNAAECIDL